MWKVRPLQRTNWRRQKSCNTVTQSQSSTSRWDELIWHLCSGSALVSEIETARKLLSWLTCFCIMTFSNVLQSFQIRPQLSNVFLIYFLLAPDFLQMIILIFCGGEVGFLYCLCCVLWYLVGRVCLCFVAVFVGGSCIYLFVCLFCLRILHVYTTHHKTCLSMCMDGVHLIHGHWYCGTLWNDRMKGFLKTIWYHVHGLCWKNKQVAPDIKAPNEP